MVIHRSGTFEYAAEFTADGFGDSDIVLQGAARRGENVERLAGLSPKIRFWNDRLVIVASGRHKSSVRNVSFPIGDAVKLAARPGDQLYIVRTGCGGIGLSLLRQQRLILATGAVTSVPLGRDLQLARASEDMADPRDFLVDTWLEFSVQGERLRLRARDVAESGGYHIYVERCWAHGIPGTDECVSICLVDHPGMKIAAMRSAILVANGDLKMVSWDTSEYFTNL